MFWGQGFGSSHLLPKKTGGFATLTSEKRPFRPQFFELLWLYICCFQRVEKISFGGIPNSKSAYIAVSCALAFSISNLHMGALLLAKPSRTCSWPFTLRNRPEPPHTPKAATPAHTGTLWNPAEPSGTCACDPHRRTPELIWAEDPVSLHCWGRMTCPSEALPMLGELDKMIGKSTHRKAIHILLFRHSKAFPDLHIMVQPGGMLLLTRSVTNVCRTGKQALKGKNQRKSRRI